MLTVSISCACSEENVWWLLCRLLERSDVHSAHCLFISNPTRHVLMQHQRAGSPKHSGQSVWDYHVVALASTNPLATAPSSHGARWFVLDVDSTLPFPCPLAAYFHASFPSGVHAQLQPLFRLVSAADYTAQFASDRSHMRREDGSWHAPPPSWPAIQPADKRATNNIQQYITMQHPHAHAQHDDTALPEEEQRSGEGEPYGRVLTKRQLADELSLQPPQHPTAPADTGGMDLIQL